MITRIGRYFLMQRRRPERLPRQFTYEYDIQDATPDELRLMRRGYARTPTEARILLARDGLSAAEYLEAHPRATWWQRVRRYARLKLVRLVMKIEGSTDVRPSYKATEDRRVPIKRSLKNKTPLI